MALHIGTIIIDSDGIEWSIVGTRGLRTRYYYVLQNSKGEKTAYLRSDVLAAIAAKSITIKAI